MENSDNNVGVLINNNGNSDVIVTFGGINQGIGIPVFEFFNILSDSKFDKIFIRDFNQMWYLKGIDEEISSFNNLLDYLRSLIKDYDRVIFLGNSMGGYAAILFGILLDVDKVISFSPQTFIGKFNRFIHFDNR